MHKSRLGALIIDCRTDDLPAQAKFWLPSRGNADEGNTQAFSSLRCTSMRVIWSA